MSTTGPRKLNDHRVEQLAAVIECGSVTAGAEALEIDPSVVSRSIARLEQEWGAVLLERKGRGVAPTEAGRLLYAYHQRHKMLKRDLMAQAEAMSTLNRGAVEVLCGSGYLKIVSRAVNNFAATYPNINFKVMTDSSPAASKRVLDDEFMLGFFFMKGIAPELRQLYSLSEPVCAIVRAGHPILKIGRTLRLSDLLAHNAYMATPDSSIRKLVSAAELYEGISLNVSINSSSIDILLAALLRTDGFTLLPARGLQAWIKMGKLAALEVDNPMLHQGENTIVARHSRMLPPAARAFAKELIAVYSGFDGDLTFDVENPTIYAGVSVGSVAGSRS